jgi:exodeoxyribonuclease-5
MTTLTQQQGRAVSELTARIKEGQPVTRLEGFAGTGKSTILPHIIEDLGFDPQSIAFMAPTGKAAKVMRSKLRAQKYPNSDASTIHSAIYRAKPVPVGSLEADLDKHQQELVEYQKAHSGADRDPKHMDQLRRAISRLEMELDALYRDDKHIFQLNVDSPIREKRLLVVDEASMVGEQMAADLQHFGVQILSMGDPGQLQPIEDKPGLCIGRPDFRLTEIHRQAADNPILHLATLARNDDPLPVGDYGNGVRVMRRRDYAPDHDRDAMPKILVGMNKTRWRITQMLREEFGLLDRGDPDTFGPQNGEPLIVCKNNREYPSLVNGSEATSLTDAILQKGDATFDFTFIDEDGVEYRDKRVFQGLFEEHFTKKPGVFSADSRMAFRARKSSIILDWGWAITVHKSQGSQWDDVVVVDESGVFRDQANKHLYTAITRAAKTLTVLI